MTRRRPSPAGAAPRSDDDAVGAEHPAVDPVARGARREDDDPGLSHRMREAVVARVLAEPAAPDDGDRCAPPPAPARPARPGPGSAPEPAETALLRRRPERLAADGR